MSKIKNSIPAPSIGGSAIDRYRCQISREGRRIDVFVAAPPEEGKPSPTDVLFMLILDASGCEMLKDYHGLHEKMPFSDLDGGRAEFDEFWTEYESRCEQTRKFKAFLGRNLYDELIIRFGFKD